MKGNMHAPTNHANYPKHANLYLSISRHQYTTYVRSKRKKEKKRSPHDAFLLNKVSQIPCFNMNINELHGMWINLRTSRQTWSHKRVKHHPRLLKQIKIPTRSHTEKHSVFLYESKLIINLKIFFIIET